MKILDYIGFVLGAIIAFAVVTSAGGWFEEALDLLAYLTAGYFLLDRWASARDCWKCPYDGCNFKFTTSNAAGDDFMKQDHLVRNHLIQANRG